MNLLLIKTEGSEAELWLVTDSERFSIAWQAERQLASTIHLKLKELLDQQGLAIGSLDGVGVFAGPGSFTSLRIGHSLANALAYANSIPLISSSGEQWIEEASAKFKAGQTIPVALPEYGRPARITKPRK